MAAPNTQADSRIPRATQEALRNITYEIMPLRSAEDDVLEHVPNDVALNVTATETKGISATVDLAVRLAAHGYRTAPHLAARLIRDSAHATDVLAQLTDAGVDQLFVIGGDMPRPVGTFTAAIDLLRVVEESGAFHRVGIGGYPEGHAKISESDLKVALTQKAPLASHVITQICFNATTTVEWARGIHRRHPKLPVLVGMPSPVSRQKLMRISAAIGLGPSARFLRKQQNVMWRLMRPSGYRPDRLLRAFTPHLGNADINISGFHLFTFNELQQAEGWRHMHLASLSDQ